MNAVIQPLVMSLTKVNCLAELRPSSISKCERQETLFQVSANARAEPQHTLAAVQPTLLHQKECSDCAVPHVALSWRGMRRCCPMVSPKHGLCAHLRSSASFAFPSPRSPVKCWGLPCPYRVSLRSVRKAVPISCDLRPILRLGRELASSCVVSHVHFRQGDNLR